MSLETELLSQTVWNVLGSPPRLTCLWCRHILAAQKCSFLPFFPLCAIKALTVVLYLDLIFWYMYLLKFSWLPFQRSRSSLARLLSVTLLLISPATWVQSAATMLVRRDLTPPACPLLSTHACICVCRHVTRGNVTEINIPPLDPLQQPPLHLNVSQCSCDSANSPKRLWVYSIG